MGKQSKDGSKDSKDGKEGKENPDKPGIGLREQPVSTDRRGVGEDRHFIDPDIRPLVR